MGLPPSCYQGPGCEWTRLESVRVWTASWPMADSSRKVLLPPLLSGSRMWVNGILGCQGTDSKLANGQFCQEWCQFQEEWGSRLPAVMVQCSGNLASSTSCQGLECGWMGFGAVRLPTARSVSVLVIATGWWSGRWWFWSLCCNGPWAFII